MTILLKLWTHRKQARLRLTDRLNILNKYWIHVNITNLKVFSEWGFWAFQKKSVNN